MALQLWMQQGNKKKIAYAKDYSATNNKYCDNNARVATKRHSSVQYTAAGKTVRQRVQIATVRVRCGPKHSASWQQICALLLWPVSSVEVCILTT